MALDANQRQRQVMERTLLQQMDVYFTSRLDACTVLFNLNFHEIYCFTMNHMIINCFLTKREVF